MAVMANRSFIERQRFNLVEGKGKRSNVYIGCPLGRMVLSGCQQQSSPKGASLTHPGGIPTVNLVHKDIVIYNGN